MKTLEEIKRIVPFVRNIAGKTYATELTVNGQKGSVIFGWEGKWEHVSFAPYSRQLPKWESMCELKDIFWNDTETVIQMHPRKVDYVNLKDNCLHLWRMQELEDLIDENFR